MRQKTYVSLDHNHRVVQTYSVGMAKITSIFWIGLQRDPPNWLAMRSGQQRAHGSHNSTISFPSNPAVPEVR